MKFTEKIQKLLHRTAPGHEYYCGEYHGGEAKYEYIPTPEGDRIADGDFEYTEYYGGGLYGKAVGRFAQGRKEGTWRFHRKGSSSDRDLVVEFVGGHISGDLEFTSKEVSLERFWNNELHVTIVKDKICGKFYGVFNGQSFEGNCDDDGFPDGQWTLTENDGEETGNLHKETWEHGKIVASVKENAKRKTTKKVNPRVREHINYLIDNDVLQLLAILKKGSKAPALHIQRKKDAEV